MLEYLVTSITDAHNGFALYFSAEPFPGLQVKLDWVRPEYGGNWYRLVIDGEERLDWLCPALLKFFPEAPKTICARAEAVALQTGRCADSRV
jgi:hypothetical protein